MFLIGGPKLRSLPLPSSSGRLSLLSFLSSEHGKDASCVAIEEPIRSNEKGFLSLATGDEGLRRSIVIDMFRTSLGRQNVSLLGFDSSLFLKFFSNSNSCPRKLKFGEIVGLLSFTYL